MHSTIALVAALALGGSSIASATTFVVNKTVDDGSAHTLRGAIEQNNLNPGGNRIEILPTGPDLPFVIKLDSLLPPVIGPVVNEGTTVAHGECTAGHRRRHRRLELHQWRRCRILPWCQPGAKRPERPLIHQAG